MLLTLLCSTAMMFGRGSPKFVASSKKLSPKACSTKRKGTSPKGCTSKRKGASPKARASWTFEQEKTLVELFHEHNNPSFRGDNGWSTEAWNKITREMNEKHPYALFTKLQIQNKEKELKRDYHFLKEARMQSGISWDDSRKMVVAEPALWENILIVSYFCPHLAFCPHCDKFLCGYSPINFFSF